VGYLQPLRRGSEVILIRRLEGIETAAQAAAALLAAPLLKARAGSG
jgi:hypothetical protein